MKSPRLQQKLDDLELKGTTPGRWLVLMPLAGLLALAAIVFRLSADEDAAFSAFFAFAAGALSGAALVLRAWRATL